MKVFFFILSITLALSAARDVNQKSLEVIKNSEGWKECTFKDPTGKLTIGYGHLIKPEETFKEGTCINKEQGADLLKKDVAPAAKCIDNVVKVPLKDNEYGALVSWTYNVGCDAVKNSTLVKELNTSNKNAVCDELKKWNKAGEKELPGLKTRREKECTLFKTE